MTSVVDEDQRRTPSWLLMGPKDGLRKRRPGSTDSMLSVSEDESLPGTSTPSKVLEKGSFLQSWLPMLSPKKQLQSNDSLCDSGFQDTLLTPEARNVRSEAPLEACNERFEVPLVEKEPRQSSLFVTYALPLAAMFAIFGALGFGLMIMNKEIVKVDQLNGKYKSMQYARERIQTAANKMGGDSDIVNELVYDYDDLEVLGGENANLDYPDDPNFRLHSHRTDTAEENSFDKSQTDSHAEQDELMDYPDNPEFRAPFV